MMKRKSCDKKFKSRVVLGAIKGELTIQELVSKYKVHPKQITKWKKQLLDSAEDIFERSNKKKKDLADSELKESELFKNIGRLQVENQFLKKSTRDCLGTIQNGRTRTRFSHDKGSMRASRN